MANVLSALSALVRDAQACGTDPSVTISRGALEAALQAIEQVNENREALAELCAAIAHAERLGLSSIDGVPVRLLICLLPVEILREVSRG